MGMIGAASSQSGDGRADALVAVAPGLAELDIAVIQVADLTDGRITDLANQANLARSHADLGKIAFLCQELGGPTRRADSCHRDPR